jgi:hypothetical protein
MLPAGGFAMHLLYNSDSWAVVQFDLPGTPEPAASGRDADLAGTAAATRTPAAAGSLAMTGFEIVDKRARREVFLHGALAERFRAGVQSLAESGPTQDQFDDFIAEFAEGFTLTAPQPVVLH